MAVPGKIMREALLASALLVRGQGAAAAMQPLAAPVTDKVEAGFVGREGATAVEQKSVHRGRGLRQMREWKAQRHAKQVADDQTVDAATANMSEVQKNQWLADTFAQVRKDMAAKGIRTDKTPIGRVFFNDDAPGMTGVIRSRPLAGIQLPPGDENGVTIGETDVQGLTVKELKAVLAHEAMHTQIAAYDTFDVQAANERTADHAGARTYGGKTYASALRKVHANVAAYNPDAAGEMEAYNEAARLRLAFPQAGKSKPADKNAVAAVTSGMTETQRDAWLQTLSQSVQQDMRARGAALPEAPAVKVEFSRGENAPLSDVDRNGVTVNETQVKRLSVQELQAVIAYGISIARQPDPSSDAAAKAGMAAAARTYGGKTFSHALGELHRGETPHDPLQKREDEAIKTNPGNTLGRLARWTKTHILPH